MTPRLLIFAILAGILFSQPIYGHALRWTEDPIAPPGHDGALILHELTIEESAQKAGLVVVGRVVSQASRDTAGSIETDVTLDVERVLKGSTGGPSNVVTFTVAGGQVGSRHLFAGGVPNFVFGERVLVFLRSAGDRRLLQLHTSKYTLAGSNAIQQDGRSSTSLPIPDVENRMRGVLGPTVAIGSTANASPQPFTIRSDCPKWTPSQYPITHRINDGTQGTPGADPAPSAPPGFPHYDIIYRALLLWQAQPGFFSAFSIQGSTAANGKNHTDGENTVAWRNLQTDPDGGEFVIGLNYCYSNDGITRSESDTLLTNSSPGNCGTFSSCFWTWDSNPDDGVTGNALSTRVVAAHEFGHEIDLNHSDQCGGAEPTPVMCPSIQAGSDKVLQADDINGATSLYRLSGAAPGAPSALSATATSSTSNTLNWTASSGGAFAYDIERATGSCAGTFRSINSVPVGQTTYLDNNYGTLLPANATYCYRVKALGVGGDSGYTASVPSAPPLAPCTNPTLSSNPNAATLNVNASMTFTAGATCGGTPQFRWWVGQINGQNVNWVPMTQYSTSNTFVWTPTQAGSYYVAFWVENLGGSPDTNDTFGQVQRTVNNVAPCTNPTLSSNPNSATLNVNVSMTFTAGATCGGTPQFRWWVGQINGQNVTWFSMTQYSTSNTFVWTPTQAGSYYVAFWVENLGGSPDTNDTFGQVQRTVNNVAPCTNPTLSSNPNSATLNVNVSMTFTAGATCGGTPQFRWWVGQINGQNVTWFSMTQYSTSNTFVWTPTQAGSYYVAFWVENLGGSPDTNDTFGQVQRTVNNVAPCTNPTLTSSPNSATLNVNASMTFTAAATCGGTPQFRWWVGKINGQNVNWVPMTQYSTSNTFVWTPTQAGSYYVAFWVENLGGSPDTNDTFGQVQRTVNNVAPCTNPTLSSNPNSATLNVNVSMTFTAGATCGGTPQFRWWVGQINGQNVTWFSMTQYSTSNTFVWTPTQAGSYYVAFWVENLGGSPDTNDTFGQVQRTVN